MGSQELFIVAAAFIFMIFLNRMLAVPQQIRLNKELIQLKKRGPVSSVAMEKSITGTRIAVLIADKDTFININQVVSNAQTVSTHAPAWGATS